MQEGLGQVSSKARLKRTKEEILEVQGGRLIRSTGRKDRHSKVSTAKGPRDRRVRLSACTAIQFYDVQDRLGYDRPSKALDWLMKEAKVAIDALDELPDASEPNATTVAQLGHDQPAERNLEEYSPNHTHNHSQKDNEFSNSGYELKNQEQLNDNPVVSFSFFSMTDGATATPSSSIDFNNYPNNLNSRTRCQTRNLCLSLQSYQENPILLQHHLSSIPSGDHQSLFSASNSPPELHTTPEIGRLQRMVSWNSNSSSDNGEGKGFVTNSLSQRLRPVLGQNHFFSSREPLQSSYSPSIPASMNTALSNINYPRMASFNPSPVAGFANDGFSGFSISSRIHGQVEEQNPFSNESSAAHLHYQD